MALPPFSSHGRQFSIERIKSDDDRAQVYAFMQDIFRVQEPITSALRCTALDTSVFYHDICAECFAHDLSLMAKDAHGMLAGIALNAYTEVQGGSSPTKVANGQTGEGQREFSAQIQSGPYTSANANRLAVYIEHVERNLSDFLPPHKCPLLKVDILAVHPMFARQGLASHLLSCSVQLALSAHCTHLAACATAVASQNLFKKFGFCTQRKVLFCDFREDGQPVYAQLHDNGTGAELLLLTL